MCIKRLAHSLFFLMMIVFLFSKSKMHAEAMTKVDDEVIKMSLNNGMKVILKHTDFDSNEILIRLQAKGGYAALPLQKRAAALMAPQIALESHFSSIVSNMLSDEDMDFDIEIMPYFHGIQGYCVPTDLDNLMASIKKIFTIQHLTAEAFERVVQRTRERLVKNIFDFEELFQKTFISVNSQNFPWLQNLNLHELEQIDLKTSQEVYNDFFSDPSEFVVVIVGNFDLKTIKSKIETYFATIPKKNRGLDFSRAPFPKNPSITTTKEIGAIGEKNSLARFTFFLDAPMDYEQMLSAKFLCMLMEDKLRTAVKEIYKKDLGIEVLYQLPTFPYIDNSWFVIQFRSDYQMLSQVKALILNEIEKLCKQGISKSGIEDLRKKQADEDEFWLRDNQYWLSLLLEYTIWNWEIRKNSGSYAEFSTAMNEDKINDLCKKVFCINHYTYIYSKPMNP